MKNLVTNYFNRFAFATVVAIAAMIGLGTAGAVMAACLATDGGTQTQTLYADKSIGVGTVSVQVNEDMLEVTYNTTDGWELNEAHLWIGDSLEDMPQTRKGSPKIGNFPYHASFTPGESSYTFSISLNVLGFSCPSEDMNYYIAAHAELQNVDSDGNVIQTETAGWADGNRFVEQGMWGTYFAATLTCNCVTPPDPEVVCETSFASGGTCFEDIDVDGDGNGDFTRWGWTNGPLSIGSYVFDIYAGANECDLNRGTIVGTLTVDYDGSTATVFYDMAEGYTMAETNLYVGNEILPRDANGDYTIAPGFYGNSHSLSMAESDTFVVENLSGDIYVVAHAVVCSEF